MFPQHKILCRNKDNYRVISEDFKHWTTRLSLSFKYDSIRFSISRVYFLKKGVTVTLFGSVVFDPVRSSFGKRLLD